MTLEDALMVTSDVGKEKWMKEERSVAINIRIEPGLRDEMLNASMDRGMTLAAYLRGLVMSDLRSTRKSILKAGGESDSRSVNLNFKVEPTFKEEIKVRAEKVGLGLTDYLRCLAMEDLKKAAKGHGGRK